MMASSAGAFAIEINRGVALGTPVALVALRRRPRDARRRSGAGGSLEQRVRAGDILLHEPRTGIYAVGLLSRPRDGGAAGDRHVRFARRRIASVLHDARGSEFESAAACVVRPVSPRSLHRLFEEALRRDERRRELAGIAHELRSPLASIRGQLELLLEPSGDAPLRQRCLQTARGEVLRLSRLIDGMGELSLFDGYAIRSAGRCDVAPAIDHAVDAIRPRAREKLVSVLVTHRSRLAARVEPDDCIRASVNILQNAIDVGARTVHVGSICRGDKIAIAIDDDGPGVAPGERHAIFEPEGRGSAGSRYAGSGFGLAAVAAIVRSCDGSISVRPSRLGGARFELRFERA